MNQTSILDQFNFMSSSDIDMDDSRFVLSVNKNDLILYAKIDEDSERRKYVCSECVKQGTKRTKRLVYALKNKANLTIKLKIDDKDMNKIKLSVKHPLYDDDMYILHDDSIQDEHSMDQLDDSDDQNQNNSEPNEDLKKQNEKLTNKDSKDPDPEDQDIKKKPLCYIYILKLEEDKYYVGKSSKPLSRTGEHMVSSIHNDASCSGSGWTALYKPEKILRVIVSYDEFDEDLYTFRYMKDYGIDNVRGGSFCELNLSHENITTLEKMLAGAGDKCYFCGAGDHYVAACPQKKIKRIAKKRKQAVVKPKDIPKSRILKYLGTSKLMQNSDVKIENMEDGNDTTSTKKVSDDYKYKCRFCGKAIETQEKLKTHENLMCKKSSIVQKGKKVEADVDAILEANKKYLNKNI